MARFIAWWLCGGCLVAALYVNWRAAALMWLACVAGNMLRKLGK